LEDRERIEREALSLSMSASNASLSLYLLSLSLSRIFGIRGGGGTVKRATGNNICVMKMRNIVSMLSAYT
jgi:hypothetical protein